MNCGVISLKSISLTPRVCIYSVSLLIESPYLDFSYVMEIGKEHIWQFLTQEAVKEVKHCESVLGFEFPFYSPGFVHKELEFFIVLFIGRPTSPYPFCACIPALDRDIDRGFHPLSLTGMGDG